MKKVLFAALLSVTAGVVYSQGNIYKGDWMLGGNASFTIQKEDDMTNTIVTIAPNAGYFFIKKLAGGLRTNFRINSTNTDVVDTRNTRIHVAPFVRYYFLPATQKVNIFADASYGFGQNKSKAGSSESKASFNEINIMAGPAIFLTRNLALEFALGFNSTKFESWEERESIFGLNIGFQIHLSGK